MFDWYDTFLVESLPRGKNENNKKFNVFMDVLTDNFIGLQKSTANCNCHSYTGKYDRP